jgi:hypothetical protein
VRFSSTIRAGLGRTCVALNREAGDGDEWVAGDWGHPLQLLCGRTPGRVLYVTKSTWLTMCKAWPIVTSRWSLITRYGPVPAPYAEVVRREMKRVQASELAVVGDLDPLDLTVLLSLACGGLGAEGRTRSMAVAWHGPRDEWLDGCDRARRRSGWRGEPTIDMTRFERTHWARLRALDVPWSRIVGPRAVAMLDGGRKMELEGASNPGIYGAGFERRVRRLAGL